MRGFTDIHSHVIYGIDDGPRNFDEMAAMLCAAHENGIEHLIASSHALPGIDPFHYDTYLSRLKEAQAYCNSQAWPMKIYSGAEILYTPHAVRMVTDGLIPTMADTQKVLVEFKPDIDLQKMEKALQSFLRNGFVPILAHIERYNGLMRDAKAVKCLKAEFLEVEFQVNCSTIINGRGWRLNRVIRALINEGLIDHIASDAHNLHNRPFQMEKAYQTLGEHLESGYLGQLFGLQGEGKIAQL